MLTESDLQTPEWLAVIASGLCVVIRGHVGEHRLEGLKAILPLGAFQWAPIELPQGEALDPEFFASIMPALLGEVPRKVYILPLVASTIQIDALAEVRANQPWLQWIAVVPDPEIDPILPEGILLFDAKARCFSEEAKIPPNVKAWATGVLNSVRSEEEKKRAVGIEGPKILATINAISAGEYQVLHSILGRSDARYVSQLVTIATEIAGVEGVEPEKVTAEIEEAKNIEDIISNNRSIENSPLLTGAQPSPKISKFSPTCPQIFESGKALPMYPPDDPVGKYARELDAVRRDPEAHEALLEMLQEFQCEEENGRKRVCSERCNDPAQKWACMRDNAWNSGMPAAIVDHWLEVFAVHITRVGRTAREAYQSFINIALQASAANTTFSAADFGGMLQHKGISSIVPSVACPLHSPKTPPQPSPQNIAPAVATKTVSAFPLPMKSQKSSESSEFRAQKLSARLDALADRIERLKGRLNPAVTDAATPQPANDQLLGTSAASGWEADDLGVDDLSLDALEKRVARLANGK